MTPVIAIVGRPNVGKSTLFNALTRTRDALVVDLPGVTRDRQYGEGFYEDQKFIVIDTGGLSGEDAGLDAIMADQAALAIEEADHVLFLVDGRAGMTPGDQDIATLLRARNKPITLLVNKIDGIDPDVALAEFYGLGFGEPIPIAASHRRGINQLFTLMLPEVDTSNAGPEHGGIKIAIIGRPNVGKSTLCNRIIGEDRVIVFDMPGTTRDSIYLPIERRGEKYTLIDTAGVRRKGKVKETVEKFSVVKTLQAIDDANVVVIVLDAQEGVTEQDLHIIGFALDAGRAMVIAINKIDGLDEDQKHKIKSDIERRFNFVEYIRVHFISAKHGSGVGNIFDSVHEGYAAAFHELPTPELSRILEAAVQDHAPPSYKNRRIKCRYAHCGGHNPPVIVIHGNQVDKLPKDYQRYLIGCFRKAFKLYGTPVHLFLKVAKNPYAK